MFRKRISLLIVLCLIFAGIAMPAHVSGATQAIYYVDPDDGDDVNHNGLSYNAAFQTIEHARDVVDDINSSMTGDIIVYLLGGTYDLSTSGTITFDQVDSGTNGYDVYYKAYSGESPIISGGKTITGWTLVSGNIYKATVSSTDNFRQIYVNGVKGIRARSEGSLPGATTTSTGYTYTITEDIDMQTWGNQSNIEFVYSYGMEWNFTRVLVSSISGNTVTMKNPNYALAQVTNNNLLKQSSSESSMEYMENAYELLNQPGEWYLNRAAFSNRPANTLYYIPRPGEDMSTATVEVPVVEKLVDFTGTLDTPVHNIRFEGINFSLSNYVRPSEVGHCYWQANVAIEDFDTPYYLTPASVELSAAKNIWFERCVFTQLGGAAVNMVYGSQNNTISGCRLTDIAGTAIQIGHPVNDDHPSDDRAILKDNSITNNYISDAATDYKGGVGILVAYTDGTTISHNEICNLPYSAISMGWGWGDVDDPENPTPAQNNIIKYNYIHDYVNHMADGGGVYTLGSQPNSEVSYNYMTDQNANDATIYCDQGTAGITYQNNVFRNTYSWQRNSGSLSHDLLFIGNYTDTSHKEVYYHDGMDETGTVVVSNENWPQAARDIMNNAGISPWYKDIIPDQISDINVFNMLYYASKTPFTPKNDYDGNIGYEFTVGTTPLCVTKLGRPVDLETMQRNHTITIWKVSDQSQVASVTITPSSLSDGLGYKYEPLSSFVTLNAGTTYRITSSEEDEGDKWKDLGSVDKHKDVITITKAVWSASGYPSTTYDGTDQAKGAATFFYQASDYADYVDAGNSASESAHNVQAAYRSVTGTEGGFTRRCSMIQESASWFSYNLSVPAGTDSMELDIRETGNGQALTKNYNIYLDGVLLEHHSYNMAPGETSYIYKRLVTGLSARTQDGNLVIKFEEENPWQDADPSIADIWVRSALPISDDFSGNLNKWVDTTNCTISNGQLTVTDNEYIRSAIGGGSNWSNYTFEADVKVTNGAAGLVFRAVDNNNFYMWQLNAGTSKLRPHKLVNGNYTVIKEINTSISLNTTYHVKIEVIGPQIKTYIDGNLVDTTIDTTFSKGNIGFREADAEAAVIDNVVVSDIPPLLRDDFSGDLSNWVNTTNCMISNGKLTVTNIGDDMRSLSGASWTDFTFEADVKVTDGAAGLVFRGTDSNNFYMWQLNADTSKLRPHKKVNGNWTVIKEVNTSIVLDMVYHIKIEASGSTIKTYIDGVLVDTTTDATFSTGKIGFRQGNADETAMFDNIVINRF